jgi:hypothetical protein
MIYARVISLLGMESVMAVVFHLALHRYFLYLIYIGVQSPPDRYYKSRCGAWLHDGDDIRSVAESEAGFRSGRSEIRSNVGDSVGSQRWHVLLLTLFASRDRLMLEHFPSSRKLSFHRRENAPRTTATLPTPQNLHFVSDPALIHVCHPNLYNVRFA